MKPIRINLLLILTVLFLCAARPGDEKKDSTGATSKDKDYEAILYELGAFPVSKLTKPYWNNGNPGKVYSKGERIDVNGWLPPYWAKTDSYLTKEEMKKYGIPKAPLTYKRYISFLDLEEYKKNRNPLLFAITQFTLECMQYEGILIKDPEEIVKVYEAKIGLEREACRLLRGKLSSSRLMELYNKHKDSDLIDLFPVPKPDDTKYTAFLNALSANDKLGAYDRFRAFKLLYRMDKKKYLLKHRDFIISNVGSVENWFHRYCMYEALIKIGDDKSIETVNSALLNDPVTECRETILRYVAKPDLADRFIESALQLADGKGKAHEEVTVSRLPDYWEYNLCDFLNFANDLENLNKEIKKRIKDALSKINKRLE